MNIETTIESRDVKVLGCKAEVRVPHTLMLQAPCLYEYQYSMDFTFVGRIVKLRM